MSQEFNLISMTRLDMISLCINNNFINIILHSDLFFSFDHSFVNDSL